MKTVEVVEKFFRGKRWYVRLSSSINGHGTMPNANFVWLQGNPSFISIPTTYVIHHLDWDTTNDDITNLVLMQKSHHVAYHWKHRSLKVKVNLRIKSINRTKYFPTREPTINQYRANRFRIRFRERIDGEIQRTDITSWNGLPIMSREKAEWVKNEIWNNKEDWESPANA